MNRHRSTDPTLLTRLTASLGAALVLVLTILAVSPALHAWLHDEPADAAPHATCSHGHAHPAPDRGDHLPAAPAHAADDDAGCVVTLFAQGGSELAVAPAVLPSPRLAQIGDILPLSVFCAPSAPAHLLPPGCGPPAV